VQRVDGQTITLKQQPTAALPIAQQSKQLRGQGEKVQTKVERSGQSLDLTIYLDPLADEEQWQKASVQPVTDDSLVIDIANKRIGYHIPGGWNSNSSQKAKQQKQSNDSQ
jgi:hypothetical protein